MFSIYTESNCDFMKAEHLLLLGSWDILCGANTGVLRSQQMESLTELTHQLTATSAIY